MVVWNQRSQFQRWTTVLFPGIPAPKEGGAGFLRVALIHILNSTIVNNLIATEATDSCGGVVSDGYGGAVSINNSILWGNTGKQLEGTQMPHFQLCTGQFNANRRGQHQSRPSVAYG